MIVKVLGKDYVPKNRMKGAKTYVAKILAEGEVMSENKEDIK